MVQRLTRPKSARASGRIIGSTSLTEALDLFILDRKVKQASPNTLRFYQRQLSAFERWCAPQHLTQIDAVTPAHIRAYIVTMQERSLADRSVHAAARALRAWFNFALREELLATSPMDKVGMPRMARRILPAFDPDNIRQLLNACTAARDTAVRDTAVVHFLLDTGCRASEFVALNGADVDAQQGTVRIRHGKGAKDRVVYLGHAARLALLRYYRSYPQPPAGSDPVWRSSTGTRLTDSGLRQLLDRLGQRADVADCHPHTFRRTFALFSLRNGMSIYHLQQLMGHADLAVLRQYLALTENDLQAAQAQYGVVDSLVAVKAPTR